ncbi:MAG: hypothetical protein ABR607_15330 [Pyrinomonadaceae bacterium]
MKTQILISLLLLISAFISVGGQTSTELQQVTLYNFGTAQHDESKSSINFETGKRGHLRSESLTDFDLMYGGMIIEKDGRRFPDWFRVTDTRSMIADLGAKNWPDINETPEFPNARTLHRPPPLANRPMVVDVSAGSKDVSPYRQFIPVQPDHMYLMRILHGNKVIYAMFRIESLDPQQSCVLSWKRVTPPKADNEK